MKKTATLILILSVSIAAKAQTHCDGIRYIDPVMDHIDSTLGLTYGENVTAGGNLKTLKMDLYYPTSEFFFERPVVVLAHGGSFVSGNRHQLRLLCLELANRGYVAATIDYRLFDNFSQPLDSLVVFDVGVKASSDMKAAVRYLKENASVSNEFGIDTNLIFIGGASAGAITALQYAYLDTNDYEDGSVLDSIVEANGGMRGNSSSNYEFSDKIRGVLNYSGAMKDTRWVDNGEPVLFSVHDEFDPVVPYGQDVTNELGTPVEVSGSAAVHAEAQKDSIRSQLITIKGSDEHVSYFLDGPNTDKYHRVIDSTGIFLEYAICDRILNDRKHALIPQILAFPNPVNSALSVTTSGDYNLFSMDGNLVRSGKANEISGIDVQSIVPGQYVLELIDQKGSPHTQTIIVQ